MITPEEIKSICTEYVDELFAYNDMSEQENIEAKNDAFVMCMAFAGHILEKHCIVPKSKVKERYEESELQSVSNSRVDMISGISRMILLENIFGTTLFNEEKE